MKVIDKAIMPNGTHIQIEDWSEDYSFHSYADTLAAYPKSKVSHPGAFSPKGNETFRAGFNFNSEDETRKAFDLLAQGKAELADYKANMRDKKYIDCI